MCSLRNCQIVLLVLLVLPLLGALEPSVIGQLWDCDDSCRQRTKWTIVLNSVPTSHIEYENPDCFYCDRGYCVVKIEPLGVCKLVHIPIDFRTWDAGSISCNLVHINGGHESVLSGMMSEWATINTSYKCQ